MNTEELLERIAKVDGVTPKLRGFKTRLKNLVVKMQQQTLTVDDWRSVERWGYIKLSNIEDDFSQHALPELAAEQVNECWKVAHYVRRWISDDFATVASAAYKHRLEAKAAKLDQEMRRGRYPVNASIVEELKLHGCGNGAWQ